VVKGRRRGAGNTPGPQRMAEDGAHGNAKTKDLPGNAGVGKVGTVSLKHVWEIAKIKHGEERLNQLGMKSLVKSVIAQAGSCGIAVVP
jgi:large subunit ribosomal protein L11